MTSKINNPSTNLKPNSKPGFFVTGTDTEVGKTLVSGALLLLLSKKHALVSGYKPVVAGLSDIGGQLQNEDLVTLQLASSYQAKNISEICPYQLETPAAPHLVAKKLNVTLSYQRMLDGYLSLRDRVDAIVVEGAGGFLVPFHENKHSGDFAKDIGLPVILVVGMRLGCISHALLTAEAIRQRGLTIAGWVANTLAHPMNMLTENIETLNQLLNAPLLGTIPTLEQDLAKTPYSKTALERAASYLHLPN
ncbi:dethiobiotin synthase [Polynucleobacter sp. MWH-Spelu-300-X4]|uniref:dethiobiotin synthase n=1 Tax=Polynucleobacter sp. MWH-Spelu-300-X4 TaxID=2689109 RepID=UPI001BFCD75E|nr:dethiobiotin synthase [Polynucleobacter sp. MWH-Spelu-300-X4]QWD79954.1 dethiobiotin synthase [Polynucleobacter sp. MWH-Spelu-300-X4]